MSVALGVLEAEGTLEEGKKKVVGPLPAGQPKLPPKNQEGGGGGRMCWTITIASVTRVGQISGGTIQSKRKKVRQYPGQNASYPLLEKRRGQRLLAGKKQNGFVAGEPDNHYERRRKPIVARKQPLKLWRSWEVIPFHFHVPQS